MHRILSKSKPMEDKTGRQNTPHYILRNSRDPCLGYIECGASNAAQEQDYGRQDKTDETRLYRTKILTKIPKIIRKMSHPKTETRTLCEPAQSKCTWGFHTSHLIRRFTGKMPRASWSTLIKHRPFHLP
jgi:hypothetical protein